MEQYFKSRDRNLIFQWVHSYLEQTPDMMFIKDIHLRYVDASRSFIALLGKEGLEQVSGCTDFDLFEHKLAQKYRDDDQRMMQSGAPLEPFVEPLPEKNGKPAWSLTRKGLIRDTDGCIVGVYGVGSDITERIVLEESNTSLEQENQLIRSTMTQLRLAAETDPLTGLLNHSATVERISFYLENEGRGKRHALLMIDIDNFKAANDQLGHLRGDEVIQKIAVFISQTFRTSDIVGRIGGDEFLVLMKEISSFDAAKAKAAELIMGARLLFENDGVTVRVSASVGVSIYENDKTSFEELLSEVDSALASAKALGKNRFFVWKDFSFDESEPQNASIAPEKSLSVSSIHRWHNVLVASADVSVGAKMKAVLDRQYIVDFVSDGETAKRKLLSGSYSLLFVELELPRASGWELLSFVKNESKTRDIPVIVILKENQAHEEIRALNMGAMDVVTKPFVSEILFSRVQNAIARWEMSLKEEQNRLYEMRLQQQEKLIRLSEIDELTGLKNHNAFVRRVSRMTWQKEPGFYVLSCLNVNGFKLINDRYGHDEGDRLLKFIAKLIAEEVCDESCVVCRDFADVFLALMPNDPERLDRSDRLVKEAMAKYPLHLKINVSIGRYLVTEPDIDVNLMIDRAKLAQSMIRGNLLTNIVWYDDSMRDKILREKELADQMPAALENGEFELWFQPQYEYPGLHMIGAEALVRWKHPQKGLLFPGEFISLFEKIGCIRELDQYVWRQCCRYLAKWKKENLGQVRIPISANVSRVDIYIPGLVDFLKDLIEEFDLSPEDLRLEITESAYMDDSSQMENVVSALHDAGFQVEMDDFGSGYSSLLTLNNVPVDRLKLDMKFLASGAESAVRDRILKAVVQMAHSIELRVIAEGVETEEQAELLQSLDCHYMQGYYFGKPMPAAQFEALLHEK